MRWNGKGPTFYHSITLPTFHSCFSRKIFTSSRAAFDVEDVKFCPIPGNYKTEKFEVSCIVFLWPWSRATLKTISYKIYISLLFRHEWQWWRSCWIPSYYSIIVSLSFLLLENFYPHFEQQHRPFICSESTANIQYFAKSEGNDAMNMIVNGIEGYSEQNQYINTHTQCINIHTHNENDWNQIHGLPLNAILGYSQEKKL